MLLLLTKYIKLFGIWNKQTPELSISARASAEVSDQLCTKNPGFCSEEPARTTRQFKSLFTPTASILRSRANSSKT